MALRKAALYLLTVLGIVIAFRLVNHHWPDLYLNAGLAVYFSYYIWRKERALDERERLFDLREAQAARSGKYVARHYRV